MCVCGARSDKSRQLKKLEQNKSYTHREHKVFPKMRKNRMFQCKKLSATHFKWHSSKCCALISIQNGHRSFTRIIVQNHFHVILFDACKCNAHHNKHNNTRKIKKICIIIIVDWTEICVYRVFYRTIIIVFGYLNVCACICNEYVRKSVSHRRSESVFVKYTNNKTASVITVTH